MVRIRSLTFRVNNRFRASYVAGYARALELAKGRKDAILLDVGCCCTE